ncbi:MAG: hypothetical protein CMO55_18265 [Verrucomicrobiales bacterium]|nr:hypothetical protein [Verrucomicrobiales bacterium]
MRYLLYALLFLTYSSLSAQEEAFPGTKFLDTPETDLSSRVMKGAHAFVERTIIEAANRNDILLPLLGDVESPLDDFRADLAKKLGVVDERLEPNLEFFSDAPVTFEGIPADSLVAENSSFRVYQTRWDVLEHFSAEGIYVTPISADTPLSAPLLVLLPDAGETPEDILGLTDKLPPNQQIGLRFALAGFRILIPAPINRSIYLGPEGKDERLEKSQQSHREWLYRQAFQMGRHPLGYEIQAALSAVDYFEMRFPGAHITLAGYGEGGRAALYAAAIDLRVDSAFVSGAFAPRAQAWSEPIDRNIFNLLPNHGDAVTVALIHPRPLLIEHTTFPAVTDRKGKIVTPNTASVLKEVERTGILLGLRSTPSSILFNEAAKNARGDFPSVAGFMQAIGLEPLTDRSPPLALMMDLRSEFSAEARHSRLFKGIEDHAQSLVDRSEDVRLAWYFEKAEPALKPGKWSTEASHPTIPPSTFIIESATYRDVFESEVIGKFETDFLPLNARTRKVAETEDWTAWDVVLDVYPELESWGVLVMPKGIPDGEKRPVVVCQHGRNGVPRDTIDAGKSAYNDFAARLAEQGYITFAPHNLYRGEDEYRWLDRKANLVGCSLFSFIVASHRQTLSWLKTLPEVDPDKIAFYGLSYGGESAVRVPAILTDYSLSICSGDFNQWTRKVADPDFPRGFMKSIEWEMPYWNMGNTFDYAELAGLILPRPFFVERGHHDLVSRDEWVAHEYAKVRWLYSQFGLQDRTGIEFFQGGHSINGEGTFQFLHHHLKQD